MSKSKIIEKPFGIEEVQDMSQGPNPQMYPDDVVTESKPVYEPVRQVKVVGVQWLNVRDAINGNKIDEIEMGTIADVILNDGPWTNIRYDDKTGWVMTQYLEFL